MSNDRLAAPLNFSRESTGVLISVLGLAAASWLISIAQMSGMDMGTSTDLGSFGHFLPLWVTMMAAMMLPGAAAVLLRQPASEHVVRVVPTFLLSYLAMWTAVGVAAYAVYQPHGTPAAGVVVIAAGLYELTPLKRRYRDQCQQEAHSGLAFGVACIGSSIGFMAILFAISPMSILWMAIITAAIVIQRLFPASWPVDMSIAVVIVALGAWILVDPAAVPGLMPSM